MVDSTMATDQSRSGDGPIGEPAGGGAAAGRVTRVAAASARVVRAARRRRRLMFLPLREPGDTDTETSDESRGWIHICELSSGFRPLARSRVAAGPSRVNGLYRRGRMHFRPISAIAHCLAGQFG